MFFKGIDDEKACEREKYAVNYPSAVDKKPAMAEHDKNDRKTAKPVKLGVMSGLFIGVSRDRHFAVTHDKLSQSFSGLFLVLHS